MKKNTLFFLNVPTCILWHHCGFISVTCRRANADVSYRFLVAGTSLLFGCVFFVTCEQATKSSGSWLSVTCGRYLLILEAEKEEQRLFCWGAGKLSKIV